MKKITITKNNYVNSNRTFSYARGVDGDSIAYNLKTVGFAFDENCTAKIDIESLEFESNDNFGKTYVVKSNSKWELIDTPNFNNETKTVVKNNRIVKSIKFPNLKNYSPEDGVNTAWAFWSDTDGDKYTGFVDPEKIQKNSVFSTEGNLVSDKWGTKIEVKTIEIRNFDLNKPEFFLKNIGFKTGSIDWALDEKLFDKISNLNVAVEDIKSFILKAKKKKTIKGIGNITLEKIIQKIHLARKELSESDNSLSGSMKFKKRLSEIFVEHRIQTFWNRSESDRERYLDIIHKGFVEILGGVEGHEFKLKYGVKTIDEIPDKIKDNPYILITLKNNGFKTVDITARQMGIKVNSLKRQEACVNGILDGSITGGFGGKGDVYLDRESLFLELVDNLKINEDDITEDFTREDSDNLFKSLRIDKHNDFYHWINIDEQGEISEKFTNKKNYSQEEQIFDKVSIAIDNSHRAHPIMQDINGWISEFEDVEGKIHGHSYHLSDEQKNAIKIINSNEQSIFCMTGFAGTGKSTVSKAILELLKINNNNEENGIECLAVSGMASRRISEATGFKSTTITSYLFNPRRVKGTKVLFIDEASMVDSETMDILLQQIDVSTTKIIFVGDVGQLPPIGRGTPFKDILESGWVKSISLEKIFRQNEEAVLTTFAKSMRFENVHEDMYSGEYSDFEFKTVKDSELYRVRQEIRVLEESLEIDWEVKNRIKSKRIHLNSLLNKCNNDIRQEVSNLIYKYKGEFEKDHMSFQLMAPQKSTIVGTESINFLAQDILNPNEKAFMDSEYLIGGKRQYKKFKIGDKVIHTKNQNWFFKKNLGWFDKNGNFRDSGVFEEQFKKNYCRVINGEHSIRVLNGMVGIIDSYDSIMKKITVRFKYEDIEIAAIYDVKDLGSLHLGYCLTIHKLQGSEAKTIGLIVSPSHVMMINNNLLYTGLTRAKTKGYIIGSKRAFKQGLKKHGTVRQTLLPLLFDELFEEISDVANKTEFFIKDSWSHDEKEKAMPLRVCREKR
jgi:exodeoxyribonuclease V alpha subunit